MIINKYQLPVDDSISFIQHMRKSGVWIFTATWDYLTVVGSETYSALLGQITGDFSGYISNYDELCVSVCVRSDVEYFALWRYERKVSWGENSDSESANYESWLYSAWQTDTDVIGDVDWPGHTMSTYIDVQSDGSFGGIEMIDANHRRVLLPFELQNNHIRVHRDSDLLLLGGNYPGDIIWIGYTHATMLFHPNDPEYDGRAPLYGYRLNTRCWIYAEALVVLAYLASGDSTSAMHTLTRLAYEQYRVYNLGAYDDIGYGEHDYGGWPFSFDVYAGRIAGENYLRNGAIAWVITAFLTYQRVTGDTQFESTIIAGLGYLINELIIDTTDVRYGLLPLGWNWYLQEDYSLDYRAASPCSTEHNIDAVQTFRLAAIVLEESSIVNPRSYKAYADMIEKSIYSKLMRNDNLGFVQGLTTTGQDVENALDTSAWGGLFLLSTHMDSIKDKFLQKINTYYESANGISLDYTEAHLNTHYSYTSATPLIGYKPYDYSVPDNPNIVWTEGTLGVISFLFKIGKIDTAQQLLDQTIVPLIENLEVTDCPDYYKGLVSTNIAYPDLPWEFLVNPSVTNNAWLVVLAYHPDYLWTPITKRIRIKNLNSM
jgi:hypothetical protein